MNAYTYSTDVPAAARPALLDAVTEMTFAEMARLRPVLNGMAAWRRVSLLLIATLGVSISFVDDSFFFVFGRLFLAFAGLFALVPSRGQRALMLALQRSANRSRMRRWPGGDLQCEVQMNDAEISRALVGARGSPVVTKVPLSGIAVAIEHDRTVVLCPKNLRRGLWLFLPLGDGGARDATLQALRDRGLPVRAHRPLEAAPAALQIV